MEEESTPRRLALWGLLLASLFYHDQSHPGVVGSRESTPRHLASRRIESPQGGEPHSPTPQKNHMAAGGSRPLNQVLGMKNVSHNSIGDSKNGPLLVGICDLYSQLIASSAGITTQGEGPLFFTQSRSGERRHGMDGSLRP